MGNAVSSASTGRRGADFVTSESETMSSVEESENVEEFYDTIDEDEARTKAKEVEMEEFKKQLEMKREQRREILARHRSEKEELERSLEIERKAKFETYEANRQLREILIKNSIEIPEDLQASKENIDISETIVQMKEEFEKFRSNNIKLRKDLAKANRSLQDAYSDIADLHGQNTESIKQISALKEVVTMSKTLINLREQQLNELKDKLSEIEQSLADREASMLSADLKKEYEKQLQNIRALRTLYEERARLAEVTRQGLVRDLEEQKLLKEVEINKCKDLTAKVEELEAKVDDMQETIETKNNQIFTSQEKTRGLNSEMSAVNKLFSQVLLGYKSKQDLDKLVHRLEENHGLLTHMAERENGSEASSALPKLLLELVSQVDEVEQTEESDVTLQDEVESANDGNPSEEEPQNSLNTTAEEIVQNLPKVWRVLMELLSHQSTNDENFSEKVTTCYKSVETNSGPVLVPSVSQTYIRLKDLIIEKLSLVKEVNRMKQLNVHLETRLEEQERRLCLVTTELSKTWHVVGRLRRHHHQLHTHEKILKYELQQKRKLLNELKEELEYCREKWEQAREKNSQSERDYRKLRAEFASRKIKSPTSLNNSAESGYSDERPSDDSSESNDESGFVTEPLIRSKKKIKKSFETILDSSTDFNPAAEREDPASDMLDVADLPLDTQEGDDNNHEPRQSDSCNSESVLKSEKVCEETEDEVGDIANDLSVEDLSVAECSQRSNLFGPEVRSGKEKKDDIITLPCNTQSPEISELNVPVIDAAAIIQSIRQQNERLAKKDKKLEKLEKSGAALLKQAQTTAKFSEQINNTLDHLINRPTSGIQRDTSDVQDLDSIIDEDNKITITKEEEPKVNYKEELDITNETVLDQVCDDIAKTLTTLPLKEDIKDKPQNESVSCDIVETDFDSHTEPTCSKDNNFQTPAIDLKRILLNVNQQNEILAEKEDKHQNLENICPEVVTSISNTLSTGEEIIDKLNTLHYEYEGESSKDNTELLDTQDDNNSVASQESSEPSTSSEIDHEARFAARDLRLKRLEEQTKSLVNKVNKTTTKGVKIHYKLEELHNIYGSENSRASTPSEDSEDKPVNNEEESQDQ